jgi:CheY-like chemotaxis protein
MDPASNESVNQHRHRILVVDDDEQLRLLARIVLEGQGFDVVEAGNGREALHAFAEQAADVVVTDLYMPEEDGLELIQEIRRYIPRVPIVATSGGGRYQDLSALHAAGVLGADEVLEKPFSVENLVSAVRRCLARVDR